MSRIGADHLAREAIVYVRQSTADQVLHNVESRRRQWDRLKIGGARAKGIFSAFVLCQRWTRGLDFEVGEDRG